MHDRFENIFFSALLAVMLLLLCGMVVETVKTLQMQPVEHAEIFPDDRELFIPVDKGEVSGGDAYAVIDRNTGIVYIYTNGALSPLYDIEGNVIIYER